MGSSGIITIDFQAATAQFTSGINAMNAKLEELNNQSKKTAKQTENIFGKVTGGELLAHGIEEVGHAAVEAGRKLAEFVEQSIESSVRTARFAQSLSLTTGQLQGLQSAAKIGAGIDAEQFAHGLEHMAASLANAASKGGPAADAVNKLGLDSVKLANQSPDKSFLAIADGLSKIQNAAQRIRLADDIFGARQAKELLPLLSLGRTGIEAFIEEEKKAGGILSDIDSSKMLEAAKATAELRQRFDGMILQLSVSLLPIITGIANGIKAMAPDADTMAKAFDKGVSEAVTDFGMLADVIKQAREELLHLKILASETRLATTQNASKEFERLFPNVSEAVEKLGGNQAGQSKKNFDAASAELDAMEAQLKKLQDSPSPVAGIDKWWTEAKTKLAAAAKEAEDARAKMRAPGNSILDNSDEINAAIEKLTREMQQAGDKAGEFERKAADAFAQFKVIPDSLKSTVDQLQAMAKATDAAKVADEKHLEVKKRLHALDLDVAAAGNERIKKLQELGDTGATDGEIDQANGLYDQQDKIKEWVKGAEKAKSLAEESLKPAEKYRKEIEQISEALKRGLIDQKTFNAAKQKLADDLAKPEQKDDKRVAALERRFDFHMPNTNSATSAEDRLVELQKEANKTGSSELQAMLESRDLLRRMQMPVLVSI